MTKFIDYRLSLTDVKTDIEQCVAKYMDFYTVKSLRGVRHAS